MKFKLFCYIRSFSTNRILSCTYRKRWFSEKFRENLDACEERMKTITSTLSLAIRIQYKNNPRDLSVLFMFYDRVHHVYARKTFGFPRLVGIERYGQYRN